MKAILKKRISELELSLAMKACVKEAHVARVTIHILALVTLHESLGRAFAGIIREF